MPQDLDTKEAMLMLLCMLYLLSGLIRKELSGSVANRWLWKRCCSKRSFAVINSSKPVLNFARSNSRRTSCPVATCRVQMPASVARWRRPIISSTFLFKRASSARRSTFLHWRKTFHEPELFPAIWFRAHPYCPHEQQVQCAKVKWTIYGGDSATGSGEMRAGNRGGVESCARNGKWITSFAAIVAPPVRLWLGARWC
jgi:hypothetical protein